MKPRSNRVLKSAFAAALLLPISALGGAVEAANDGQIRAGLPAAAFVQLAQAAPEPAPAVIPGEAETTAACGNCHGGEITAFRSDRSWDQLWSQMLAYGMPPQSREMREIILTYLKTYRSSEREEPATAAAVTP